MRSLDPLRSAVVALASLVAGCGYADEGLGPPDIGLGPVRPIRISFTNASEADLFLDWSDDHGHFTIEKSDVPMVIDARCVPSCAVGCSCEPCVEEPMVRRLRAGETVSLEWAAVHYEERHCGDAEDCVCAEPWPLTAGKSELVVQAYGGWPGGTPRDDDPDLFLGASVVGQTPWCEATAAFSLAASTVVTVDIACEGDPD